MSTCLYPKHHFAKFGQLVYKIENAIEEVCFSPTRSYQHQGQSRSNNGKELPCLSHSPLSIHQNQWHQVMNHWLFTNCFEVAKLSTLRPSSVGNENRNSKWHLLMIACSLVIAFPISLLLSNLLESQDHVQSSYSKWD